MVLNAICHEYPLAKPLNLRVTRSLDVHALSPKLRSRRLTDCVEMEAEYIVRKRPALYMKFCHFMLSTTIRHKEPSKLISRTIISILLPP